MTDRTFKSLYASIVLLVSASTSYAVPVGWFDNGGYTTDTNTSLDWLDLTFTTSESYSSVAANFSTYEGGGWRYATNSEIEMMFDAFFTGWTADGGARLGASSRNPGDPSYATDVVQAEAFTAAFGVTDFEPTPFSESNATYGFYMDEFGMIRVLGANTRTDLNPIDQADLALVEIYGPNDEIMYNFTTSLDEVGIYLVREPSAVPEPPILALIGLGLAGMVFNRKKKTA